MKNKIITPGVLEALKRWYLTEKLTQETIAQIAGVNRSSVNAWLAGEAHSIRALNWARMLPRLRQYLPPEEAGGGEVGILPESERLLEEFRRRLQDAVMSSDLDDAVRLRDRMKAAGKSATTIFHVFSIFRGFLRWLNKEGMISSPYVVDNFLIDLPPVRKVNTPIIPPSKADEAMTVLPDWTLIPRVQRYTGMRIGEVEACFTGYLGCGIVTVEGFRCFQITKEFCKTHADRYVPISDKLAPYITPENIATAAATCARFEEDGRRQESPAQKRYNRAVKKIEGCESAKDHSWRVYAQTMMIEAGIDDLIVRRIIGHKDRSNVHYGYTAARVEAMKKALDTIP